MTSPAEIGAVPVPQPHGGAIYQGGLIGNRGGSSQRAEELGPLLPDSGLRPRQSRVVIWLAGGYSIREAAERCDLPVPTVKRWLKDPAFVQAVQQATDRHAGLVRSMLLEGEREAAATVVEALHATTHLKVGKELREMPNWDIRVRAALSLLDRGGERGKAVDRVQQANLNVDVTPEALHRALRDPGVRTWLDHKPDLKARVAQELRELEVSFEGEPSGDGRDP